MISETIKRLKTGKTHTVFNGEGSAKVMAEWLLRDGAQLFRYRHKDQELVFFGCVTQAIYGDGGTGRYALVSFGCPNVKYAMSTPLGVNFSYCEGTQGEKEFWIDFQSFATQVSINLRKIVDSFEKDGELSDESESSPFALTVPGESA